MVYRFGGCELDLERRELRDHGALAGIEPQVFDVLAYLVVHHDRVVTKEELLDNVWRNRFVSESALTSRIKSARRTVGDTGQSQHVIRTIHGRGYRFVAPVDTGAAGAHDPQGASPRPAPLLARRAAGQPIEAAGAGTGRAWPLLGRASEVEWIGHAFREIGTGGVLLTGPAGVGKTRLAHECVRLAHEAGVPVAHVAGHPETRAVPLAALAHLLPPDVAQPTGPEGELHRAALFHRARAAIEQMTGGARGMMLVDDIDQLDDLSRALIVSLVHARAVFVAATLRTSDSADDGLTLLVKDGHLRHLDVGPLATGTVEALLHRVVGGPIEGASLAQLVEASTGNPGVLRQLVESAWDAGNLVDRDGVWVLDRRLAHASPTLELLVAERLAGLADEEREAVELLAVAGELSLAVLSSIVDDVVLESLERRGLLQVAEDDRRIEVTLAHPLFAEVLRNQLPTMRSRRLRRVLADAVIASGTDHRSDQIRVVAWRLEAGGRVDASLLAEAARLALVDGDDAMAQRILDRADSVDRTPEIVQLQAELKFRCGETDAVEELLAPIHDDELDDQFRAQILRRRATNLFYGRGQFVEGAELLTRGLDRLSEPGARQGLEAYHVLLLAMAGLVGEAVLRSEQPLGHLTGAPRLELLRGRALALATAGRGDDALALVGEGWALHESLPADLDRPGLSLLLFAEVLALGQLGRLDDAEAAARRALARRPDATTAGWLALAQARLHLAAGRPAAIREGLDPLVRATRVLGHGAMERWALALVASARLLEGDRAAAAEDLARVTALESGPRGLFHPDIDRAHAWLAAELDGLPAGCERLRSAASDAARLGKHALEAALLHDVVRFGEAPAVVERLGQLADVSQGDLVRAWATHAAAAAAADPVTLGRAVTMFEQCGATLLAAEAATQLVDRLAGSGDRRSADEARARAGRLRATLPKGTATPLLGGPSPRDGLR